MPKITKQFIENQTHHPASGQIIYRDDELCGFALRVTQRSKTFIVEKRVEGKNRRISIGRYGQIGIAEARQKARQLLSEMERGSGANWNSNDPMKNVTLSEAFAKYLSVRPLAATTRKSYTYCIETCLSDWLDLPFNLITKDMVEERHRFLTNSPLRNGRGQARANVAMKTLKSVLNFASERYSNDGEPLLKSNPVDRLTANKQWHKKEVRTGVISPLRLPDWYEAVSGFPNQVTRDYLTFLLFTGMRRNEASLLRWAYVDLKAKTINVPKEITKMQRAYQLPISDFISEILTERLPADCNAEWVFPSARTPSKRIATLSHFLPALREACGYDFVIHDLRRTFLTVGARLEIPFHILKSLVNHKIDKEITERYIIVDMEGKRDCIEKITHELIKLTGAKWVRKDALESRCEQQLLRFNPRPEPDA
ncbi:MAG TPA: integrase family protein [Planktothrix sp.]|jgi:integrase